MILVYIFYYTVMVSVGIYVSVLSLYLVIGVYVECFRFIFYVLFDYKVYISFLQGMVIIVIIFRKLEDKLS